MTLSGKRPKLIATDLDGTIVVHGEGYAHSNISDRTIAAFTKARDLGIQIYFVTGRPPRWMAEIKDAFGFGNSICANGAQIYDCMNDKVLEEFAISIESQLKVVKTLREYIPNVSFAVEYGDEFHHEYAYIPRWDIGMDIQPVDAIEERILKPAFKMLARCSGYEMTSDEMLGIAKRLLGDTVTVTHSNPDESLLEISALGVSKGETLALVASRLGLTADDCVSFGDNPNDISMLSWTSRSWAMGDGHEEAKRNAKFVTDTHHSDAVARIIEELLELPV